MRDRAKSYSKPTSGTTPYDFCCFFSLGSPDGDVAFLRPASRSALSMIHSICPFTLRNSSAAHFSSCRKVSSFMRNMKFFLSANCSFIYVDSSDAAHWKMPFVPVCQCKTFFHLSAQPGSHLYHLHCDSGPIHSGC